ncbi:MAG: hypothetical protein LBP59_09490 [Planctomycetaceae bacterium]|jgi:hypothetical protein|nr:hypothetical protein [Planctomycetaceae bacterium]
MRLKSFLSIIILLILPVVICSGCSGKTVKTVKVTGKITIDGNPIEQGSIKFMDVNGEGAVGGGSISNGTYVANVPVGKKKTLVLGTKLAGKEHLIADVPDSSLVDKFEVITPPEYNSFETTPLEAEIKTETNNLDFNLSSNFGNK